MHVVHLSCECVMDTKISSQHRRLTMEKNILPLLLPGLEPETFPSRVQRSATYLSLLPNSLSMKGPFTTGEAEEGPSHRQPLAATSWPLLLQHAGLSCSNRLASLAATNWPLLQQHAGLSCSNNMASLATTSWPQPPAVSCSNKLASLAATSSPQLPAVSFSNKLASLAATSWPLLQQHVGLLCRNMLASLAATSSPQPPAVSCSNKLAYLAATSWPLLQQQAGLSH